MNNNIELEQVAQINSNFESSGRVYSVDGLSPTINTCGGGQREVKISEDFDDMKDLKNEYADEPKILKYTRTEYGKDIRKQYEDGEIYEKRANMVQLEAREDGLCNTLTSVQKDNLLMDNPQDSVLGKPNLKTQMCNQLIADRVVEPKAISEKQNYRIRKLTPKECGRLMCVKDDDVDKIAKHQGQHSQYHLYGDSICCFPLMAIFGEMLDINWQEKVNSFYDNIKE